MKRPMALLVPPLLAAGLSVAALAQPQPDDPGQAEAETEPSPAQAEADKARRARVVANVGKRTITLGEVEDAINAQSAILRARYREPERLREFVSNMIRFELLAKAAKARGYGDNPAVVRSQKQNAVQHLIRIEFEEKVTPDTIPEADVREYYDTHQQEFHRPEMVRAAHVRVDSREAAVDLIAQAKKTDARGFRELAREHSTDTETKFRGGDLRYFTRDGRPPRSKDPPVDAALVAAAFSLTDVGDVVDEPVQIGQAWSVVKLTGRRPAQHRPLEEADQAIRMRLWRLRRQDAVESFVKSLRERFKPTIHEDRMAPIRLETEGEEGAEGGEQAAPHAHGGGEEHSHGPEGEEHAHTHEGEPHQH